MHLKIGTIYHTRLFKWRSARWLAEVKWEARNVLQPKMISLCRHYIDACKKNTNDVASAICSAIKSPEFEILESLFRLHPSSLPLRYARQILTIMASTHEPSEESASHGKTSLVEQWNLILSSLMWILLLPFKTILKGVVILVREKSGARAKSSSFPPLNSSLVAATLPQLSVRPTRVKCILPSVRLSRLSASPSDAFGHIAHSVAAFWPKEALHRRIQRQPDFVRPY